MSIAQLRLAMIARKHGAATNAVWASSYKGSAHFDKASDAEAFMQALSAQVATVTCHGFMLADGTLITAVDWTQDRMPNGYVTPIRSEYHA